MALYEQFLQLWREADPELQPVVADVARRLETLRANSQRASCARSEPVRS